MKETTIHSFLGKLPEGVAPVIVELWASANIMDLNYGSLAGYLAVINQRFQETKGEPERAEEKLKEIRSISKL